MKPLDILVQEAVDLFDKGKINEAESLLLSELKKNDLPLLRTRLASLRMMSGNPGGVMEMITPLLKEDDLEVCMMATRALTELDQTEEAGLHLDKLVKLVDSVMATNKGRLNRVEKEFPELVMNLAGTLGQHRRVLELYKRWPGFASDWLVRHYVAVAAFNLGRYKQAASHWSAIGHVPEALSMQHVAVLAERGTVPPFIMEYAAPNPEVVTNLMEKLADEVDVKGLESGIVRMALLCMALDEITDEQTTYEVLALLILGGGEWGLALGLGLIESTVIDKSVKSATATLLIQAGVFLNSE
jgi:tetratricopeptide (TPR) repeat protein